MDHLRTAWLGVLVLVGATLTGAAARAATPLSALRFASDITASLGSVTLTPAGIGEDDLAGGVALVDVGALPADAHIDAYQLLNNGAQLLSFDTTVVLPGGLTAGPADVVRFSGGAYTLAFDAAAAGVPEGANVDAVAVDAGDLLLSFDTSVTLTGATYADEDLVRFPSIGVHFSAYFTGADAGVADDLDLDGAQVLDADHLLASFDGSGRIGGTDFNDDDVLEYDASAGTWEVVYRGVSNHSGWEAADLVAPYALVVEPSPTATAQASATATAPANTATPTATSPGAENTPTPSIPGASPTATAPGGSPTATATGEVSGSPTPTATGATPSPTATPITCLGDCNGSGTVSINELITMVNIALERLPISSCPAGDGNHNDAIAINELIAAVGNALNGC